MWIAPHFWAYYRPQSVQGLDREPFEWIEYDQTTCGNVYGDLTCQAVLSAETPEKCYNTLTTCQRVDNFASSKLTLRFCRPNARLPLGEGYWFPYLKSAKVTPAAINPGGGNKSASALGTRAKIVATLTDHPHTDRVVDPYATERITGAAIFGGIGYDPLERSSFWRKWSARNLYKVNRAFRYCSGYLDAAGNLYDVVRREFLVTSFTGPNRSGDVQFEAQDVLTIVNNDKTQAPAASSGKLAAAITAGATSASLQPAGVGNKEYPSEGYARIGGEVMAFSRSGNSLTLTRGQFNTTADDHDEGAAVQLCLRFFSQTPAQIIRTLLVDYGQVPESAIDTAQWQAETVAYLQRRYSCLIAEPTGIKQLLSEISEQMYCYIFFDERAGLIRLRAVRPASSDIVLRLDDDQIVESSTDVSEDADQQITRVVINYAPRDYAAKLGEITNYRAADVFTDLGEESPDRSNGPRVKTIFSRWLEPTDGAAAQELGARLLARYRAPPRKIEFDLDAKDRGVWVGDFVNITTGRSVDAQGNPATIPAQIMSVNEVSAGSRFRYSAQQFLFDIPTVGKRIEISADVFNIDLRALYDSKYATPPGDETITFIIRTGVVVGSTSVAVPAIVTGSWPAATLVHLYNYGHIVGRGGKGASTDGTLPLANGQGGGTALKATNQIYVWNYGTMGGGGGGGGAYLVFPGPIVAKAGDGGCGALVGQGGNASGASTTNTDGVDGVLDWGFYPGGLGQPGLSFSGNGPYFYGSAGGAAGWTVDGFSLVGLANVGDFRWSINL
jgi:hypothetical protein